MFEIFDSVAEKVLVFCDNKLTFSNERAQIYFKSYSHILDGRDISEFISEESLADISARLLRRCDFNTALKLKDGTEKIYMIRFLLDDEGRKSVMFIEKADEREFPELIFKAAVPKVLYDPLKMGKAEIYINELKRLADPGYCALMELKDTAVVKRSPGLLEKLNLIARSFDDIMYKSCQYLREINSEEGYYAVTKNVFSLYDMMDDVVKKINNFIKIENLDIAVNYSSRFEEILISANYSNIKKAVSGLVHNSIKYIMASGRKGRIDISLVSDDEYAIIKIKDNGIGLSEETFGYINNDGQNISSIEDNKREEFINLQIIDSYVEVNNGSLKLENLKEKGSLATIKFPILSKRKFAMHNDLHTEFGNVVEDILRNGMLYL